MKRVTSDDEWCAEAYLETDYTKLTHADFEKIVRNYAIYKLVGKKDLTPEDDEQDEQ